MTTGRLSLEIITYSLALWLGLYLMAHHPGNLRLRWAGLGLTTYSLSLATDLLNAYAPTPALFQLIARLHWPFLFFPSLFWLGVIIHLLPAESFLRLHLNRLWSYGLLPAAILFYLLSAGTSLIFNFDTLPPRPGPAYLIFAGVVLLPMLLALLLAWRSFSQLPRLSVSGKFLRVPTSSLGLLLTATLFFTLGAGLLIFPLDWLPRVWLLVAIGLDLLLLGLAVAVLDAFDEGEVLLPDFLRSFDDAMVNVLLFGGLVALAMVWGTGVTFSTLVLLLATIAAAIATQAFADPFQTMLDRLAFARFPHLQQARAQLRAAASALPRVSDTLDFETLDEVEFTRLTRRALSHLGDLPRLATSPLTHLPLIEARLAARGVQADTLKRTAELKTLLAESIAQLKPRDQGDFGTSEAWRYYNALYFPYVLGLKPYSRRGELNGFDPLAHQVQEWFQTQVPERTLHNWQNAAAKLIAQDLKEQLNQVARNKVAK